MNTDLLKKLYYQMLRIRIIEERIAELYPEQEIRCPVHLCIGQEAIAVGVAANLSNQDYVLSGHRSHGHYLAVGGNLKAMIAELYGKETGCAGGKGGSMHLVDLSVGFLGATPIVASTIPIAVGVAFGIKLKKEQKVVVVFFGEGATEEGVFHESLNFAQLKQLPVVFVCENNLYSVYSPLSVRQPQAREVVDLARGHGIESLQGDGNDVKEVYSMAIKAIERVRTGGGPTFLEFQTYRWREHCGPNYDNDLGYRTQEEFERWRGRCPIARLRDELFSRGIASDLDFQNMSSAISNEIECAVKFAKGSPFPQASTVAQDVYAP